MRNLFAAVLAALTLSASAQAPASAWTFELDVDCNGTTEVYEAVSVNAGTTNVNAQLTAPDGSTKNFHANIAQGTATLEGQDVCGCVTTPDTGEASGNVTHCIGMDATPADPCEMDLVFEDDWGSSSFAVTHVATDGEFAYVALDADGTGSYYYTYYFTPTTTNILTATGENYSYSNDWGETIEFTGDFAACVASLECEVVECPEDLTEALDECQDFVTYLEGLSSSQAAQIDNLTSDFLSVSAQLNGCQSANAGLSDAVSAQGAQINDLQATIDSLEAVNTALTNANNVLQDNLATVSDNLVSMTEARDTYYDLWIDCQGDLEDCGNELNAADGIINNLSDENADLAADLYECQTDLSVVEAQADNCAEMYQDYQLFYVQTVNTLNGEIGDLEDDLAACDAVNDSLLNDLADLTVDLANMTAEADTCFDEYSALDDQFIAAVDEYEGIIDNLNTQLDELADQSVTIIANLQDQLDDCTATSESLAAQLDDCETAGIAIVSELQNQLLNCQGDLADAQEAASACSAAIETAVANAFDIANEECNATVDSLNYVCMEEMQLAYDAGREDGYAYFEDEVLPELLWLEYQQGYNDGQADCGEVSGLVDIDGTTIAVIGYYNELGQTIDPARATGVIIRRHEDGTFSKYIKTLR